MHRAAEYSSRYETDNTIFNSFNHSRNNGNKYIINQQTYIITLRWDIPVVCVNSYIVFIYIINIKYIHLHAKTTL